MQVAQDSIEAVSAAIDEVVDSAEKSSQTVAGIKVEEPDDLLGRVRYIDTPTAHGIIRYDRKTHSSTLLPNE